MATTTLPTDDRVKTLEKELSQLRKVVISNDRKMRKLQSAVEIQAKTISMLSSQIRSVATSQSRQEARSRQE